MTLNGTALDPASVAGGRLALDDLAADNVLEVDATMAYSHDGQGLHRSTDPADGEDYVYGHLFLDAAPTVFACFDQPDLKAPYTRGRHRARRTGPCSATAAPRSSPPAAPSSP